MLVALLGLGAVLGAPCPPQGHGCALGTASPDAGRGYPWVGHPGLLHRLPMCKHTGMHRRLRRSPLISRAVSAACSQAEKSCGRTAVTGPPPCGGHAAGWGPAPAVTAHVLNLVSFHVELV